MMISVHASPVAKKFKKINITGGHKKFINISY